ncbi:hypothetical protein VST7929_03015 [Vibrio stylophorae]|uniref:AraC family transcriptional regulator n=1 Tax=Vibrio stylophorae TaxID=659351 RepID=A0ABM8ZYM4_9VIBR|nr:hypothetical protein [Vibrio stylophorae]CAH0535441.1 hypothetical protein VST7929_03015 [Vibrio stylophorae]
MQHFIECQQAHHHHLSIGARKKQPYAFLYRVLSGQALVRLGKQEWMVEANEMFWLPFDCLAALTCFPGCQLQWVQLSPRVQAPRPSQAGFVSLSPLTLSLLDALQTNHPHLNEKAQSLALNLLAEILVDSAMTLIQPATKKLNLSRAMGDFEKTKQSATLTSETQQVLLARMAFRAKRSGQKLSVVSAELNLTEADVETLCQRQFGQNYASI